MQDLGYLALAIVHARAYIQECCPLGTFLEEYRTSKVSFLKTRHTQTGDDYEHTVFTTWKMSFNKLRPLAATFLSVVAFMHHDGVREAIFSNAASRITAENPSTVAMEFLTQLRKEGKWDSFQFRDSVVRELISFSLITHDRKNDIFSIHPLVHFWIQSEVGNRNLFCQAAQTILALATDWRFKAEDYAFRRILLPHVQQAVNHEILVDHSSMSVFGLIFRESGLYTEAEKLQVVAMETMKRALGDEHPDTLTSMANLAEMFRNQGRWNEAEKLEVVVMETRKRVLGDRHRDTLTSMARLASTFRSQGRWDEAEKLQVVAP